MNPPDNVYQLPNRAQPPIEVLEFIRDLAQAHINERTRDTDPPPQGTEKGTNRV